MTDLMFSSKKMKISQLPKETFITKVTKEEKKKQLGPAQYERDKILRGKELTQQDETGMYKRGLTNARSGVAQLTFLADVQERAKKSP